MNHLQVTANDASEPQSPNCKEQERARLNERQESKASQVFGTAYDPSEPKPLNSKNANRAKVPDHTLTGSEP